MLVKSKPALYHSLNSIRCYSRDLWLRGVRSDGVTKREEAVFKELTDCNRPNTHRINSDVLPLSGCCSGH